MSRSRRWRTTVDAYWLFLRFVDRNYRRRDQHRPTE